MAVLPFVNSSGDADGDYLSDGITESLIANLSQVRSLRVTARSTVFRYKGKEIDPQKIGQDLHVGAVLSGRLLQRDGTLVVRTELMDVTNGSQLWGGQSQPQGGRRLRAAGRAVEGNLREVAAAADRRRKAATDEAVHRQRRSVPAVSQRSVLLEQTEPGRSAKGDRVTSTALSKPIPRMRWRTRVWPTATT